MRIRAPRGALSCCLTSLLLVTAGCHESASTGVSIDSAFRPFISPDTKALADIDLEKLRKSPLYLRHAKDLTIPGIEDLKTGIGFDPQRDAFHVLVEWNGRAATFLVRGTFDLVQIERRLTALGMKSRPYRKYRVLGDQRTSVVFVSRGLALAGPAAEVQRAIDLETAGKGAPPEELEDGMRGIGRDNTFWLVSRGGLPFAEIQMRSDVSSALSNIVDYINGVTAGVAIDTGLRVNGSIRCTSEQGARRVHDALRGGIAIGRLSTKDDQRDLLSVYDAINVDQEKSIVRVKASYPADLSDRLISLALGRK